MMLITKALLSLLIASSIIFRLDAAPTSTSTFDVETTSSSIEFLHKEDPENIDDDGIIMTVISSTTSNPKKWYFKLPPPTNTKATFVFNSEGLLKLLTVQGTKYRFNHKKNKNTGYFELKSARCIKNCGNNRYLLDSHHGDSDYDETHLSKNSFESTAGKENRQLDTSCGACKAAVTAICTDGFVNQFKTCTKITSRIPAVHIASALTLLCTGVTATFCYLGSEVICDPSCDDDMCDPINQKECDGKCVDKDWCCVENGDTYCNDGSNVCIPKGSTECCPSQKPCGAVGAIPRCISKNDCCLWTERFCEDESCIPKGSCCPSEKECYHNPKELPWLMTCIPASECCQYTEKDCYPNGCVPSTSCCNSSHSVCCVNSNGWPMYEIAWCYNPESECCIQYEATPNRPKGCFTWEHEGMGCD